ncbi:unnamed protein product [Linum trigynum]|uniref:Uncharacterized protein n=1 Tax=Linum trigynum TaxID=586398 RepID=A0AAV2DFI5_9ROSI
MAITGGESPGRTSEPVTEEPNPGFGPWMLVTRKNRRNLRDTPQKAKSEGETRNINGGVQTKQGKIGGGDKEGGGMTASWSLASPSDTQRTSGQERKGGSGKKGGEEGRKGKGTYSESQGNGKGILGSGPENKMNARSGPKDQAQASTSAQSSDKPSTPTKPKPLALVGSQQMGLAKTSLKPDTKPVQQSSPPTVQTITGENGTIMQIVHLQPKPVERPTSQVPAVPSSTKDRTKRGKAKQADHRRTPTKLSPLRGLHIGTPKKERRSKSKGRIAALTMQEIAAWTSAANSTTGNTEGGARAGSREEQAVNPSQTALDISIP